MRFGVEYKNGLLENVERPLLPKESYMVKTYGNENGAPSGNNLNQSLGGSIGKGSVHEGSIMKDENGATIGGLRESLRNSRASGLSQRSIITNLVEKPISLAGSKAAKGLV
jgi:hypothetical protein